MNPLGDGASEALSCLLSGCPMLARLSLQACQLTARFLQQHRLLLASALAGQSLHAEPLQETHIMLKTKVQPRLAGSGTTVAFDLSGRGHLRSVCLSHNALGSTGFELVLKTLPLHCLTHLDLSAVCQSAADFLPLQHLPFALSQVSYMNQVVSPCLAK